MATTPPPVGVVLPAKVRPERLAGLAQRIEAGGFASVWLPEDAWDRGGIASLMAVLDATRSVRVGFGIASGLLRHPAALAMELATIAAIHPGRLIAGIGLGVPAWLARMGLTPRSQLGTMRETMLGLRRLLEGEELTWHGERATYDRVRLTFPPVERVPLLMGVTEPRMLALSGEVADGTIATEMASVPYLRWARERIASAAAPADPRRRHTLVAYAWCEVDDNPTRALERVRPGIAASLRRQPSSAVVERSGLAAEVADLLARHGPGFEAALPVDWLRTFSAAGDARGCADAIRARLDAGADEVALHPGTLDDLDQWLDRAAWAVLPRIVAAGDARA